MNRKHSCGKRGMILISKTMLQIMLSEFSKKKKQQKTAKFSTALTASRNSAKHYCK